ncbi:MAG TPA: immunoglobulin domain-containing protein [Opitutus sp.]|nr:immunoglobulin domain-containing protein [Opitutus sp.]
MHLSLRLLASVLVAGLLPATASAQSFTRSTTRFPEVALNIPSASIAFGNGVFVGLGLKGRAAVTANAISVYTSTDGDVWTERTIDIPNVGLSNHGVVRFINGHFVFTGRTSTQSYVARSANGVTWTVAYPTNLSPLGGFQEIAEGGGKAVGIYATQLSSTADGGVTWSSHTAPGIETFAPYSTLAYGGGRFVLLATGTSTKVWTSTDAASWTEILAGQQTSGMIAYGNGIFVLTGTNYKTSTDGVNFTTRSTPAGFTLAATNVIRFTGDRFLYQQFGITPSGGFGGMLMASTDGLTWSYFAGTGSVNVFDFVEGNGRVVIVGWVSGGTLLQPTRSAYIGFLDTPANPSGPAITTAPQSQSAVAGGNLTLNAAASGTGVTYQWMLNGAAISGATSGSLALNNLQPANAGLYAVAAKSGSATATSSHAIVGVTTTSKVIGTGTELSPDVKHPNGNIFDQVLLTGSAEAITADHALGQITRTSYLDLDGDIVQVEFSGPGTLSLVLDSATGPAAPALYNQPSVSYMKGHAGIVITGATEATNVSVFTVGRATAFDPTGAYNILQPPGGANNPANNGSSLFTGKGATVYDGIADLAFIAIQSSNGKFGGLRTSNAHYFASKGLTGLYAPGVAFQGPVFVGDISAFDSAAPVFIIGSSSDTRITGGDLEQANGVAVEVAGLTQLKFTAGGDSHGNTLAAQANRAVLKQNGATVTSQIVVNP